MEFILNRLRGTGNMLSSSWFIKDVEIKLTGNILYALYIFGLFTYLTDWMYGLAFAILYIVGESYAWGKWVGCLITPNYQKQYDNDRGEGFPYITQITDKIINQRDNYLNHCRLALTLRGFVWWSPIIGLAYYLGLTNEVMAIVSVIGLSIGFPLGCELSKKTNLYFKYSVFQIHGNWEEQEFFYGIIQTLLVTVPLLYFNLI